jgi:tRNA A-37 threonylcarbamoyl transferase component Bud32
MSEILSPGADYAQAEKEKKDKIWTGAVDFAEHGFNPDQSYAEKIGEYVSNPEKFVGSGGIGKVFSLEGGFCVKMMINRHNRSAEEQGKLDLGNSPQKEVVFQKQLEDLEVRGVYVPKVLHTQVGETSAAIVMEQLDAADMKQVLIGNHEMPPNFKIDDFFDELHAFFEVMHAKKGIAHGDVAPRNIMIDKKTGKPRLIDFGRSSYIQHGTEEGTKLVDEDFENLEKAYEEVEAYLENNK